MNQVNNNIENISHILSSLITEKVGKSEIVIRIEEILENSKINREDIEASGDKIAEQCTSMFNLGNQQGSDNFSVWYLPNPKCFVAVKPPHSHR